MKIDNKKKLYTLFTFALFVLLYIIYTKFSPEIVKTNIKNNSNSWIIDRNSLNNSGTLNTQDIFTITWRIEDSLELKSENIWDFN